MDIKIQKYKIKRPYLRFVEDFTLIMTQSAFFEVFNEFNKRLQKTDHLLLPAKKGNANNDTDMSFCITLPEDIDVRIVQCNNAGHVKLQVQGLDFLKMQPSWEKYKSIETWLDERNYILQTKISKWIEEKMNIVLTELSFPAGETILTIGEKRYRLSVGRSDPAMAYLNVQRVSGEKLSFTIEVLPCFSFRYPKWPNTVRKDFENTIFHGKEWYVIAPKHLNTSFRNSERFWRVVFSGQEREILHYHKNMAVVIRFIRQICKVYRMHHIKPYFINTLFLWEIQLMRPMFWTHNRPSFLYLHMLRRLQTRLRDGNIPFFWDARQNLIDWIPQEYINSYLKKLDKIFSVMDDEFCENPVVSYIFRLTNPDEVIPNDSKGFFFDYRRGCYKVSYVFHYETVATS